jgi:hypothetical protein
VDAVVDEEVDVAGVVDGGQIHGAVVGADEGASVAVHCKRIVWNQGQSDESITHYIHDLKL